MPYPHVTQLETRLRLDRIEMAAPRARRSRRPWRLSLRIAHLPASRNVGGLR